MHLGYVDLLHTLFGEVLIPPAVVSELDKPRSKFPPISVQRFDFVRVAAPRNRAAVEQLLLTLGPGEAEALVLAVEVGADAILMDESAGRAVARQRGLLTLGVLGILLRARQRALIGPLQPSLDRLQSELGFFISAELRAEVLKEAGE